MNTAKFFSPALLDHIKGRKELQQGFVMENKFMVGHGDESKFRLSDEYGKHELNLLFDKLDV
eukprot:8127574-Lingulodinium_polyedra.AAC.1